MIAIEHTLTHQVFECFNNSNAIVEDRSDLENGSELGNAIIHGNEITILELPNAVVMVLAGNTSSLLQAVDAVVLAALKRKYTKYQV